MSDWRQLSWKRHYDSVATLSPSLPSLPHLRRCLDIETINTGRRIHLFGATGLVSDDLEGLHATCDKQGRARLRSGIEFSLQAYRGQTQEHSPCLPALARLETPRAQLLALCRNVAFEDTITDHPFVRIAERSTFLDCPLFVDKEGLAQHYGLPTHMLDVTSNFDVASFFATSAWNSSTRKFEPVTDTSKHGIIYRLTPVLLFDPATSDGVGPFHTIGWQPLPRPEQQRAFAVKMKPGQDFCEIPSVERFPFRHRARVSHRIWKGFDEGRTLFPADAAAELATQAEKLHQFTRHQIDCAWQRLDSWTGETSTAEDRSIIENDADIIQIASSLLNWDGLDVETDESRLKEKLQDVLNQVRYRMAAYL